MRTTVLGLAVVALCAAPALAQTPTGGVRLGAGLSMQFDSTADSTGIGFTVDFRGDLRPVGTTGNIGWVGDFSLHNFGDDDFTTTGFHGGVAYNMQANERIGFYVQFLLGVERCCDTTAFSIQPGGGVNINITPGLDFRAAFDYRNAKYNDTWFDTPRIWFGISRVFGGM